MTQPDDATILSKRKVADQSSADSPAELPSTAPRDPHTNEAPAPSDEDSARPAEDLASSDENFAPSDHTVLSVRRQDLDGPPLEPHIPGPDDRTVLSARRDTETQAPTKAGADHEDAAVDDGTVLTRRPDRSLPARDRTLIAKRKPGSGVLLAVEPSVDDHLEETVPLPAVAYEDEETTVWQADEYGETLIDTGASVYDPGVHGIVLPIYEPRDSTSLKASDVSVGVAPTRGPSLVEQQVLQAARGRYQKGTTVRMGIFGAAVAALAVLSGVGVWLLTSGF